MALLRVNRSYIALFVITSMSLSTARGIADDGPPLIGTGGAIEQAFSLSILMVGLVALRAIWQRRASPRRIVAFWASLVLGLLIAQDVVAGFLRDGLPDRLFATGAVSFVLFAVVWLVSRHLAENR